MPYGNTFESNLATLNSMLKYNEERAAREQARAAGYLQAASENPYLASPENNGDSLDYGRAIRQMFQSIVQNPLNADPDRVKQLILSNELLKDTYGRDPGRLEETVQRLATRTATGNYDPLVDEDPRANLQKANRESSGSTVLDVLKGAGETIANDIILDNVDALQKLITGESLTERNRVKEDIVAADRYLASASPELKSGAAKLALLKQFQAESQVLEKQLNATLDPDAHEAILRQMSINNQKISNITNSLSDAEKAAYEANGAEYEYAQQQKMAGKERLDYLTPRYQMDVDVAAQNAQLEYEELIRNGKASVFDNPVYGARYLLNQFASPAALARNAKTILPWVAVGMFKPFFALAGGVGLAGSLVQGGDEYIDEYFDKHGTLEGYNAGLASLMNGIGFIMDLAGGKLLGGLSKNMLKQSILGQADKVLKPALEASIATGSNAPLKAGFKTVFNNLRLDKYFTKAGVALKDKAGKVSDSLVEAGKSSSNWLTKGLSIAGNTLEGIGTVERLSGQALKHAAVSDLSLAFENATATAARQAAAQNGMDKEAITKAALEGLASGHLGMAQGAVMAPAVKAAGSIINTGNKYLRTEKEEQKNREFYDTLTSEEKYKRANSEVAQFEALESKIYEKEIDKLGEKTSKKFKEELAYDKGTHTLSAIPGKTISKEAQKAIDKFEDKKESLRGITDKAAERREYYQDIASSALNDMVKEKGIDAYTDATIRSAFAKQDIDEVTEKLQKIKGISEKSARLQAEMLTNKKADVSAKDLGITEDALNTANIMGTDSTLLTDIGGKGIYKNDEAVDALGKADFTEFGKAIDKQIAQNNAQITTEKNSSSPNTNTIAELENLNKRLQNLKEDYTQDKWNNKKNALITDRDTDDYIRKMDKDVLPDKKSLGITDETALGKSAADIENALNDIRTKGIDRAQFIDSIIPRNNKGKYVDNANNVLSETERDAYTAKIGKYYDDYMKQLNENIESYNIRQQYKTFKSQGEAEETLKKHNAEKAFNVKKVRNYKTKSDEYYAEMKQELDSDKTAKLLETFIAHPKRVNRAEIDKILNDSRAKEIIKNSTSKSLLNRVWHALPGTGTAKKTIDNFDSKVFDSLSEADQKEMLKVLQKSFEATSRKQKETADAALKAFQISELRRYSGYKQKKEAAFNAVNAHIKYEEMLKLNKRDEEKYKAFNGTELSKMNDNELAHFLTVMVVNNDIISEATNALSAVLTPNNQIRNDNIIRTFLTGRHADFDRQIEVLRQILSTRLDGEYKNTFREIYNILGELQEFASQRHIAPTATGGKLLWTQETIDASRKESFTTSSDYTKNLFSNLYNQLSEVNTRIRVNTLTRHSAMTNSQELTDFNDEFIVSDVIKPEARDTFIQHMQTLSLQHSDSIFNNLVTNYFNTQAIWDTIGTAFYVTDRDRGINSYSTELQHIIDTSESTVTKDFLRNNAQDSGHSTTAWLQAFQNLTRPNQRIVVKDLLNSKLVLAYVLGQPLPNYDPLNPANSTNISTIHAAEYETARQNLRTQLGITNNDAIVYLDHILNAYAEKTNLVDRSDIGNLNNDSVMAYLSSVDENSDIDSLALRISSNHALDGFFRDVGNRYFGAERNEYTTWRKPTYTELERALRAARFNNDDINTITRNYGRIVYRIIAPAIFQAYRNANLADGIRYKDSLSRAFNLRGLIVPHYETRTSVFRSEDITDEKEQISENDINEENKLFNLYAG